ncbi:hypothetical protein BH11MYX1_BH11MYX1_50220 [soil metagenome]
MRIACIHIPQYALQCATRLDPSLRGAAIAMVDAGDSLRPAQRTGVVAAGVLHVPVVVACSRAAWALGVRLGMPAPAVRSVAPDVSVVAVESASERETVRAIADSVLGLTPIVDVGGRVGAGGAHLAMYAEVPQKTRGSTFGERVIERLSLLGLTGRVGIADDRFTAWVAAAYGAEARTQRTSEAAHDVEVTMVPRGGSAAFLAPRPLSLLAISVEVQHMLEALGVRTLGEFAALPAPSVSRPLDADYRALARGESGSHLRVYTPEAAIREELVVANNVLDTSDSLSGPTAISQLARRIALRLAGRARAAARVELSVITSSRTTTITPDLTILGVAAASARTELPSYVEPARTPALSEAEELARAFAPILEVAATAAPSAAWRLRATVIGESVTTMNEHDLAVTTELTMPVRTFEPIVVGRDAREIDREVAARELGRASRDQAAVISSSSAAAANISHGSVSMVAVAAAGSSPSSTATAVASTVHAASAMSVTSSHSPTLSAAHGSAYSQRASEPRAPHSSRVANANTSGDGEHVSGDVANSNHYGASHVSSAVQADPLAVVLSTSGALFALSAPGQSDRAAREHRRARRGKQRRTRSMTAPVQARLFDRR